MLSQGSATRMRRKHASAEQHEGGGEAERCRAADPLARIGGVEAMHWALLRSALGEPPIPDSLLPESRPETHWRHLDANRLRECIHRVEQETGCDSARPGLRHAGVVVSKPPPPSVAKSVSIMRLYEAWNAVDGGGPYPGRMLGDIMRCLRRAPARAQPPGAPRARRRDRCAPSSPGSRARVSLRQSPGPRPCRAGGPRASARSHARTP